jgi:hypothetical protein
MRVRCPAHLILLYLTTQTVYEFHTEDWIQFEILGTQQEVLVERSLSSREERLRCFPEAWRNTGLLLNGSTQNE